MKIPRLGEMPTAKRLSLLLCIALLIAVCAEFVLANYRALFLYDEDTYPYTDLSAYYDGNLKEDGSYLLKANASGGGLMSFSDVPGGIYSITVTLSYIEEDTLDTLPVPTMEITATDPRTSWSTGGFITVSKDMILVGEYGSPATSTVYASIENSGRGRIRLTFAGLADDVRVESVLLNRTPTLTFSAPRVTALFVSTFLLLLLFAYRHHPMLYDPDSSRHRALMILPVIVTLLFTAAFLPMLGRGEATEIAYPLQSSVERYQPYVQQFDAWMKGQLHLDIPVSDELLQVENPYDYASRVEYKPMWDRAYYEGHYYSYFGITPILLCYLPHYLIFGTLPVDDTVMLFFLVLSAIFIPLTVKAWADLHEKRTVPFPLLFLAAVTAFLGSLMPLTARGVNPFYYIATLSGNALLAIFLFLLLSAEAQQRPKYRYALYAASGVAYGLLFLARINIAVLAAFIVLPYLVFRVLLKPSGGEADPAMPRLTRLRRHFAEKKTVIPSLLALGIPVAIAIGAAMVLNFLRFDNPFEFGTSYQFTVSDIRYNHLSLTDLFPTIYHYFLQPLSTTSGRFPFVALQKLNLHDYGHYVYIDVGLGLFSLPLFCILLLSPAALRLKSRTRYEKTLLVSCLIGILTVALMNFSLGGAIFRYTCDLTQMAALASVFLTLAFAGRPATAKENESGRAETRLTAPYVAAILFLLLSAVFSVLLSISENPNLAAYPSEMLYRIWRFFTFG